MKRRSLFLALAAGFVVNLALAAPSKAGTEYLTVMTFQNMTAFAADDLEVMLPGTMGSPMNVTATVVLPPATTTTVTTSSSFLEVFFSPAVATGNLVVLSFTTDGLPVNTTSLWTFKNAPSIKVTPLSSVSTPISVPEPASMALLGIGMTGFLALRRLFKRASVI